MGILTTHATLGLASLATISAACDIYGYQVTTRFPLNMQEGAHDTTIHAMLQCSTNKHCMLGRKLRSTLTRLCAFEGWSTLPVVVAWFVFQLVDKKHASPALHHDGFCFIGNFVDDSDQCVCPVTSMHPI